MTFFKLKKHVLVEGLPVLVVSWYCFSVEKGLQINPNKMASKYGRFL